MIRQVQALLVGQDATLRAAMSAIDAGAAEIAVLIDENHRLVGVLTDGDVRRALLGGHTLDAPALAAATCAPVTVTYDSDRAGVLDLMRARGVAQIPVLDADEKVVGLHTLDGLLRPLELPSWAVVMAGGLGQRLHPITEYIPKPMAMVGGRPILERIVRMLADAGVRQVYLAVNYLREVIEDHFGDGSRWGVSISYLRESPGQPLGTAGALSLLPPSGDPVLVMNGDLITSFDPGDLIEAHRRLGGDLTVAVRQYTHEVPFGVLSRDGDGTILGVEEKPLVSWPVNAGIYVVAPHVLDVLAPGQALHMTELIVSVIERGGRVVSWDLDGDWLDVGRPKDLREARARW